MAHRTALLIDASKGFDGEYQERVQRLLQSVNGSNIKVDVFHTVDGKTLVPGAPTGTSAVTTDDVPAKAALKAKGYVQVLTAEPGLV